MGERDSCGEAVLRPSVESILQRHWAGYGRTHRLPGHVRKAVKALMSCRTAVLGGHVRRCPEGHVEEVWYNSCRHRFCPQCGYRALERWLQKTKARLLRTDHYHGIFTIPDELNGLWLLNVVVMSNLLFRAVRDTLFELLGDAKHLGAYPGVILALHSHGQTLILHPHIHALITGGGLKSGQWVAVKNGYLLPGRVVMALFRGKLLAAIRKALRQGKLVVPAGESVQRIENVLNRLGRVKWHVHIMERYGHGEGVASYIARYLRGAPMRNSRLLADDGDKISFRYQNNHDKDAEARGKADVMTLAAEIFIQRLLLHVPPPRTHRVRSYGLYAPNEGEKLNACRALLGQGPVDKPEEVPWQERIEKRDGDRPTHCPVCGKALVRVREIAPTRPCGRETRIGRPTQRAGPQRRAAQLKEAA